VKHFSWIITIPITVIVVIFALANRQPVQLDLWPFEISFAMPLFLLVLGCLLVGFFVGATVMWVSDGRVRRRERENRSKVRALESEMQKLKTREASPERSQLSAATNPQRPGS
jgi:putative membrane protein